jgi:hypothetical protein
LTWIWTALRILFFNLLADLVNPISHVFILRYFFSVLITIKTPEYLFATVLTYFLLDHIASFESKKDLTLFPDMWRKLGTKLLRLNCCIFCVASSFILLIFFFARKMPANYAGTHPKLSPSTHLTITAVAWRRRSLLQEVA